jgi:hypothetical protein
MTAKEKAKELVDSFVKLYEHQSENYLELDEAKLCALIAVLEIEAECLNWAGGSMDNGWDKKRFDYWQEVKQEIEKL